MKLLITRPEHDIVTSYLSDWSKDLIKLAEEQGFKIKDLNGKSANKQLFESFLKSQRPELILLNGHGNENQVCGFKNEPLIEIGTEELLKGAVVHALACESSLNLGLKALEKGTIAYFGYKNPFCFITEKSNECRPNEDRFGKIFKIPAMEVPKNLISGKTMREAYENAINKYKESIINKSSSFTEDENEQIRLNLFFNMNGLTLSSNKPEFKLE